MRATCNVAATSASTKRKQSQSQSQPEGREAATSRVRCRELCMLIFVYMKISLKRARSGVTVRASVELSRGRSFSRRRIEMDLVDLRVRRRGSFLVLGADELEAGQEESPEGLVFRVRKRRLSTRRPVVSGAGTAVVPS